MEPLDIILFFFVISDTAQILPSLAQGQGQGDGLTVLVVLPILLFLTLSCSLPFLVLRWTKFSAWYYNPEATRVSPHRKAFLEGEVTAAMGDEIVRLGMESEGMLEEEGGDDVNGCRGCDVSDFLVRRQPV